MLLVSVSYCVSLVAVSILGGKQGPSPVPMDRCSSEYWWTAGSFGLYATVIMTVTSTMLLATHRNLSQPRVQWTEYTIEWTGPTTLLVLAVSLLAGFVSGFVALSPSFLLPSVLVTVKVPSVFAAPTALLVVPLTASAAFLQYTTVGVVTYSYSLWYSLWAGLGAVCGLFPVKRMLYSSGKSSPVLLALSLVAAFTGVLTPIYTVLRLMETQQEGKSPFALQPFCPL